MLWELVLYCALALLALRLLVGLITGTLLGRRGPKLRTMLVLGSGGHTAEMMALLRGMDTATYTPRCYVVAETDKMSGQKAVAFEQELAAAAPPPPAAAAAADGPTHTPGMHTRLRSRAQQQQEQQQQPSGSGGQQGSKQQQGQQQQQQQQAGGPPPFKVVRIPRSREVGQSFITSIWTTLYALSHAVTTVLLFRPDLVLVNGPGTCIPICAAALLARLVGLAPGRVVYVESIARVYRLSLSGKILYHSRLATRFFVQWPDLQARYPRSVYAGRVL